MTRIYNDGCSCFCAFWAIWVVLQPHCKIFCFFADFSWLTVLWLSRPHIADLAVLCEILHRTWVVCSFQLVLRRRAIAVKVDVVCSLIILYVI